MEFNKKIDELNTESIVKVLYKIGLFILIPLILLFVFLGTDKAVELLITENRICAFRRITGFYCPGCGGTRSSIYLARFRFTDSFKMNASVLVGAVLYIFFIIRQTVSVVFSVKSLREKHVNIMLVVFLATILINWIVHNISNFYAIL